MKIIIASDSFKGSLTSAEVGEAIKYGIERVADADIHVVSVADGGDGTLQVMEQVYPVLREVSVTGPDGRTVSAKYRTDEVGLCAMIEMAEAAGLTLMTKEGDLSADQESSSGHGRRRRKLHPATKHAANLFRTEHAMAERAAAATTYGVGELILDAVQKGCKDLVLGLGGSATSDGGVGMLQALGIRFLTKTGKDSSFGNEGLAEISRIDLSGMNPALKDVKVTVICDVANPLIGLEGAVRIYGPQKGVPPEELAHFERRMRHYAGHTTRLFGKDDTMRPGAGAAGGLGYAAMVYLNATPVSGVDWILDTIGVDELFRDADLVITGEGRMDEQTLSGKVPIGVARRAKLFDCPVVALCGACDMDAEAFAEAGIDVVFPIVPRPMLPEEAMSRDVARDNVRAAAERMMRLYLLNHEPESVKAEEPEKKGGYISLHYEEAGEGEPLVLLHGNGEDSSYFKEVMDILSDEFHVLAPDTRGHGKSPRGRGAFTLRRFVEDLRRFLDERGLDQVNLLGFSDGGNIAMLFAMRYPERVKRLILNGVNLNFKGLTFKTRLPILAEYRKSKWLAKHLPKQREEREHTADLMKLMLREPNLPIEALKKIRAKTLVVVGTDDMICFEHTMKIFEGIESAELGILSGDHFVAMKSPRVFSQMVRTFLQEDMKPQDTEENLSSVEQKEDEAVKEYFRTLKDAVRSHAAVRRGHRGRKRK